MSGPDLPKITKVTTTAYKKLPKPSLEYATAPTKFGNCLGAFRGSALCFLTFYDDEAAAAVGSLQKTWPGAFLRENAAVVGPRLERLFEGGGVEMFLKGTDFEIEVWEALLKIERGVTCSYEDVAVAIGRPKAIRAAAGAVARNNIAYFVPCHRVIKKDGSLHRYGGGPHRKAQMLRDEGAL